MNAVFGALLAIGATCLYAANLLLGEYSMLWLPSLVLAAGLALLLRNGRDDEQERAAAGHCVTCHGAGTVYTDEWNDWRRSGPIRTIRELCPSCEGTL